jgi:uncharacterized protein YrrD
VFTLQGRKIGELDRVVVDPQSGEVTHVVVRRGLVLPEDKVVPVDMFSSSDEQRLIFRGDEESAGDLPDFKEDVYLPLDEKEAERLEVSLMVAPAVYPYPPYLGGPMGPPLVAGTKRNIPEGSVPLSEGAAVTDCRDQKVGDVVEILTRPGDNQLSHFVVSQGILKHHRRLVPAEWIDELTESEVHLVVGADFLESALPEYIG